MVVLRANVFMVYVEKKINSIINRTWEDTHSSQTEIVRGHQ